MKDDKQERFEFAGIQPLIFDLIPSAALTLPETEKKIEEKGYKGVKKYLYTGFVELPKFLFMPAKYFSALHDNFDTFQYEKRILRTRIVKAVIFSFTIASILAVSIFLPPAAGFIPIAIKSGILLATAAFSVTFFGIIIHALNDFIENTRFKVKKITFTVFTAKSLEDKLNDYISSKDVDLERDVKVLLDNKKQIDLLFKKPEAFKNGRALKLRLQNLIEVYYLKAIEGNHEGVQDSLLNLIYGFYTVIDSLALQEALVFGYEKTGKADINAIQYEILKFFYVSNAIAFKENYDKENIIYRINNQKRMMRLFFSGDKLKDIEKINSDMADDMNDAIFMNAKLESFNSVEESDLSRSLNEEQLRRMVIVLKAVSNINYLFEDIQTFEIPKQIGYMYIKAIKSKDVLESILSGNIPVEYRLYALLRMSTVEENPFSIEAYLTRLIESRSGIKEDKITISKEIESKLYEESTKVLDYYASINKFSNKDNYLDSLEAEMLFTAAAVSLHGKYPDINLADFLKQLQYTFVRDANTEYIVNYAGSSESELFRISMKDGEEYVKSINDLVENIYKRNTGINTGDDTKYFVSTARGRLSIISIRRKAEYDIANRPARFIVRFPSSAFGQCLI